MKIQFIRDFAGFAGGHLKVFHYFQHASASNFMEPEICFTPESVIEENPWGFVDGRHADAAPEAYFLAGMDWFTIERLGFDLSGTPVINLVQGVRHADPGTPLYECLQRSALRICVSAEVADAILSTGRVNGPVAVIPAAIEAMPAPGGQEREVDVVIAGLKNHEMAVEVASVLESRGLVVDLMSGFVPRDEFLLRLGHSRIAVLLPHDREGFFLPPLEAMGTGTAVVVPDCVGNRSFCLAGENCIIPPRYTASSIVDETWALSRDAELQEKLVVASRKTVQLHSLAEERRRFLKVSFDFLNNWGR